MEILPSTISSELLIGLALSLLLFVAGLLKQLCTRRPLTPRPNSDGPNIKKKQLPSVPSGAESGIGFRVAPHDMTFNGFSIPKSWKIMWTPHSTHRNPKYFPDPDKFDPSRFQGAGPAPFTFTPFGGGPRMCPGNEFAE